MHDFLSSIGFFTIKSNAQIKKILKKVVDDPTEVFQAGLSDEADFTEYRKAFGPSFGIAVRGEMDRNGKFHMSYYYPYFTGNGVTTQEQVDVEKHAEKNSYAGICDELRLGVTMIFYLQNVTEYMKWIEKKKALKGTYQIVISGLARDGRIILPLNKTEREKQDIKKSSVNRSSMIAKAREGDEDAMENLTLEDIDTYTMLSRRVLYEDVFTIVDTCFMPYGIESDQYFVVGEILDVKKTVNEISNETVYQMKLDCNDLIFDICVNEESLLGVPAVGRRFKGAIWAQGQILFADRR